MPKILYDSRDSPFSDFSETKVIERLNIEYLMMQIDQIETRYFDFFFFSFSFQHNIFNDNIYKNSDKIKECRFFKISFVKIILKTLYFNHTDL